MIHIIRFNNPGFKGGKSKLHIGDLWISLHHQHKIENRHIHPNMAHGSAGGNVAMFHWHATSMSAGLVHGAC